MRLFTSIIASAAMLFVASAANAAVTYTVTASTSDGSALDAVTPGAQLILDIGVTTTDNALGVAGSVNGYDNSVVSLNAGASTIAPSVFNAVCFPASGCFGGLSNQIGSAIVFQERAVGPGVEAEFLAALGLSPAGGNGATDDPFPQFQVVYDVTGAPGSSTTLNIGTFAAFLDGYTGTVDSDANNTSVSITVVPEPGTALLMGLGLAGLAAAGRRQE